MRQNQKPKENVEKECYISSEAPDKKNSVLQLGQKITNELGLDKSCETLSKWMSHYLADLMDSIENTTDCHEKEIIAEKCCAIILKLWEQKQTLPSNARPLGNLGVVIKTIEEMSSEQQSEMPFFQRYRDLDNPWLQYARDIHKSGHKLSALALLAGILEEKFSHEKVWRDSFSEHMEDDEIELIDSLDHWLELTYNRIFSNDVQSVADMLPDNRADLILDEIIKVSKKQIGYCRTLRKMLRQRSSE
jgi:hypothetical protein